MPLDGFFRLISGMLVCWQKLSRRRPHRARRFNPSVKVKDHKTPVTVPLLAFT